MGCASSQPATLDRDHLKLAPAYSASKRTNGIAQYGRQGSAGNSLPASRTHSGASRLGSSGLDTNPGAALDAAARAAAAAAVKQAKRENGTLQARLTTTQERLTEADGGRMQALKALQEAWKRIDDLEQRCAAARAEGHTSWAAVDTQLRDAQAKVAQQESQLQGLKAEKAVIEAKRAAEAAESRRALDEIDYLQARLASTQEEVRSGSGGAASEALRVARAQVVDLRGQLAAAHEELQANAGALAEAEQAQSQIDWLHRRLLSATEEVQVGDEALQQALGESREQAAALQGALAAAQTEAAAREAAHQEALDAAQDQLEHFQELAHTEQMAAYAEVQRWAAIAQASQQALANAGLSPPPPASNQPPMVMA